jgi:hypothetical protein
MDGVKSSSMRFVTASRIDGGRGAPFDRADGLASDASDDIDVQDAGLMKPVVMSVDYAWIDSVCQQGHQVRRRR